jgi:hypothetical protein
MPHDLIPRNLLIGQQALFAFVDVLAKTFLTPAYQSRTGMCTSEPPLAARPATTDFSKAFAWEW